MRGLQARASSSAAGRVRGAEPVGTVAPKKHLFLNVLCECLLGTLRGEKRRDINERLGLF